VPQFTEDKGTEYEGLYVNRFTQASYIPGSIFKIVTLAAALEAIPDIQEQAFSCTGSYAIGNEEVTCEDPHWDQTLKDAFRNSCNCAFAQIALQLGAETLEKYVEKFGVIEQISFDGITFDHAETEKHSLNIQDVESFYMVNCTVIGDGEYGLSSPGSNGTGASKIEKCKFIDAGLQLAGKFSQNIVIDNCEFDESVINVQGGGNPGPTIQYSKFSNTLTSAHNGGSFYVIRNSNAGANIKVRNCEINVDAEQGFTGVAGSKGWGVFVNRIASYDIDVKDVKITMTDSALAQSELNVAKCLSTGKIYMTGVTVNGVAQ
jgi:hypothetical protein